MKRFIIILMLFTAAVSAQQNLTKIAGGFGEIYFAPLYSPDGSMLAFTSESYKGIWIYKFSDQSLNKITDEISSGFGFSWSQDSKYILSRVAVYEGIKRLNAVKIFDVKSGESENISGYHINMPVLPQWSNGDNKVFTYSKDELKVYETGKTAKAGAQTKIAFIKGNKIAVGDILTENIKTVEPLKDVDYINLSLSPDGSKIVFEVVGGNMYSMNSDGSGLVNLGRGYRPKWSPDSRLITYMLSEDDGHSITASDLYSVSADGSGRKKLTNTPEKIEMNPSFSPDGKSIVFDEMSEGAIYIMKID